MIHWKRIVPILTVLVLILLLSGCTDKSNINQYLEESEDVVDEMESLKEDASVPTIEIQVDPPSINVSAIPKFVSITVTNVSEDMEYRGSYHYTIEHWDNNDWVQIHCPAVQDESVIIPPAESVVFEYIQLNPTGYDYTVGKYRVNYNNCSYGEFSIIDE